MTSRGYIMIVCWALLILDWTSEVFAANPLLPLAFMASFLIMEWTGMFKKELARFNEAKDEADDPRSQRQIDFMRKLEEGKQYDPTEELDEDEMQARIYMRDEEGNESFVIIKPDGTVETEGEPDPDVVQAVYMLKDAIKTHGAEAMAEELGKQIEKIKQEKH